MKILAVMSVIKTCPMVTFCLRFNCSGRVDKRVDRINRDCLKSVDVSTENMNQYCFE